MSFAMVLEYVLKVIVYVSSQVSLKQKWASFALLGVSGVCLIGSIFNIFNYWRIFLIAIVFFINSQSITIFIIKLYFLREEILYDSTNL